MKCIKNIIAISLTIICLTSCGDSSEAYEMVSSQTEESTNSDISTVENVPNEENFVTSNEYDVDLTQLSSSMVYSQVYDMVYNSDDYIGKTVKAKGSFSYYQDPQSGNEYFAVLISDATACCAQGIEFVLDDHYTYPDDYPELGTEITITGKFNYYKEEYYTYCQLLNAEMIVDDSLSW